MRHKLEHSVEHAFNSFKDGFLRVCGGKVLHFLHPQELMELVVGSQDYDFVELEKVKIKLFPRFFFFLFIHLTNLTSILTNQIQNSLVFTTK